MLESGYIVPLFRFFVTSQFLDFQGREFQQDLFWFFLDTILGIVIGFVILFSQNRLITATVRIVVILLRNCREKILMRFNLRLAFLLSILYYLNINIFLF